VVEGGGLAVAYDKQLAVENRARLPVGGDDLGKAGGDVVTRAREDTAILAVGGDLHPHAVPLPFCGDVGGNKPRPVVLLDRVGELQRTEDKLALVARPGAPPFETGKKV